MITLAESNSKSIRIIPIIFGFLSSLLAIIAILISIFISAFEIVIIVGVIVDGCSVRICMMEIERYTRGTICDSMVVARTKTKGIGILIGFKMFRKKTCGKE